MKPLSIKDPFLFGEWFDVFWFHSCFVSGQTQTIRERLGYGISQLVDENEGSVQRIYFSRQEWTDIGRRYLNDVVAEPKKLETVLADIRDASADLIAFCATLRTVSFETLDVQEQIRLLKQYHEKHHLLWTLGQIPNVLELENSFLTDHLKAWLREQQMTEQEQIEAFQILVTPRELSMAQKEERDMLGLVFEAASSEKLKEHWQTYSWLQFGWIGPSLSLEYFVDVYQRLHAEGKATEQLEAVLMRDAKLITEKQAWVKRLEMPNDVVHLFWLLEELLSMKTYRMDALFMSYEAIQPLLLKIARDHFLSLRQVYGMYQEWIIEGLEKGKLDAERINAIMKYSVQYFDGEQTQLFVGDEATQFIRPLKEVLPPVEAVNELKGECAFPGLVEGTVCVVNRAEEMKKFHDGDVLVSNVTDPSLLPIMKKASAFVTNQGGLTCHAAIVARELHVPCVIGTKVATHVLKDGDRVEVDATKGIVKKVQ